MEQALVNADKAGDVNAAKLIANAIKSLRTAIATGDKRDWWEEDPIIEEGFESEKIWKKRAAAYELRRRSIATLYGILLPPIGLLFIGCGLFWAVSGFRK